MSRQRRSPNPPLPREVADLAPTHAVWSAFNLGDLWLYRELIYFLTWRDVKVRYKQTALGAAWAILQPFLTMVVFTISLAGWPRCPSDGIPYPLFSYTGTAAMGLFTKADRGRRSLAGHEPQHDHQGLFPAPVYPIWRLC